MKAASSAALNTIKQAIEVTATPRLLAEWEHNRFSVPTVTVAPAQTGADAEWVTHYDLSTVGMPFRPSTGIAKARLNNSKVTPLMDFRDSPNQARFYPSSDTDTYKYFSSWQKTKLTGSQAAGYAFDAPVVVTTTYPTAVIANKIVVGLEISYSKPVNYSIECTSDGTHWNTVATNPVLGADGLVSLYINGSQQWSAIPDYTNPVAIKAVRVSVSSMADPYAHLDVLQVGARLHNDLTEFLVSYDKTMEVSSRSFIAPMGKASSNEGNLTLSNIDLRFNNDNVSSVYHGLIDRKVRFTLDVGIDTKTHGGSGIEYFREFTMWADVWGGTDQSTTTVTLKDSSVLLQELKVPHMYLENSTVGAVVWQLMDEYGFTNYAYSTAAASSGQLIPYYWPTTNNTLWDEFAAIAEATQTAVYFDEYDVMQIKPRDAMYQQNRPVDWAFSAVKVGSTLPDIVKVETNYDLFCNQVDVTYKPTHYSDFNNGTPKMEAVWQPTDQTIALHSTPIVQDMTATSTDLYLDSSIAAIWPWTTKVDIEGEIIEYDSKEYLYYLPQGGTATAFVKSLEEQQALDNKSSDSLKWKNQYTGRMHVTGRGLLGTTAVAHHQRSSDYTGIVTNYDNTKFHPDVTIGQYGNGYMRVHSADPDIHTYSMLKSDTSVMGIYNVTYGTRMRFLSDGPEATAGLFFAGDWGDAGYYLEISPTNLIDTYEHRTWRHELSLVTMPGNAPMTVARSDNGQGTKGFGWVINANQWYTIDVKWVYLGATSAYIIIFIDGVFAGDWFIGTHLNTNIAPPPNEGRFGMFVRGNSVADFEYLYAVADGYDDSQNFDNSGFNDLINGGFNSGYMQQDGRYDWRFISPFYGGNGFPQMINRAQMIFDEFGPQAHEIMEFSVDFEEDKTPVLHSYPLATNTKQAVCLAYTATPFGAKFLMANTDRRDAIIHGDDTITNGPDNALSQTLFVYGRCLYQDTDQTVTKTNDAAIRREGTVDTKFNSKYLQTADQATALGNWILDMWDGSVEEVTVTAFGNPFIQLGDLVTINYPMKGMAPTTHRYFVTSIKNEYTTGLTSEIIIRRARV